MKQVKIFDAGENIPDDSKFISLIQRHNGQVCFAYELEIWDEPIKKQEIVKPKIDNAPEIIGKVLNRLNELTGKKYSTRSAQNNKTIRARLNEGYSQEDLIKVVENMCSAWMEDEKMCPYLRPETLFRGGKIESYLNYKLGAQSASDAFAELESYMK